MNHLQRKMTANHLAGHPATVLVAMILANGAALTASDLTTWTGLSRPSVSDGLSRLAEHGLVTHHGQSVGWVLNNHQLSLWQGHSGIYIQPENAQTHHAGTASSQKADYQTGELAALTQPVAVDNSVDNCGNDGDLGGSSVKILHSDLDQIRSDLNSKSDFSEDHSDLILVCKILTIDGDGLEKLTAAGADAVNLLGWYLDAANWGANNPAGYALKCTLTPRRPIAQRWLDYAEWFLDLYADEQQQVLEMNPVILEAIRAGYARDLQGVSW